MRCQVCSALGEACAILFEQAPTLCRDGGTGRRSGLKIRRPLRSWGFDPPSRHHKQTYLKSTSWKISKSFVPKLCQKCARIVPSFPFPASLNRQQSTARFTTRLPPRTATSALANKANVRGRTAFALFRHMSRALPMHDAWHLQYRRREESLKTCPPARSNLVHWRIFALFQNTAAKRC